MILLAAAALAPAIILMVIIYRADKQEKEPVGLIVKVLLLGAVSCIPAVIFEIMFEGFILAPFFDDPDSLIYMLVENFLGVALIEELCKGGAMYFGAWKNNAFNYVFDGIVYCVAAALGFAALENLFYVMEGGLGTAALRAVLSVPGHCTYGIFMGYFIGRAKYQKYAGQPKAKNRLIAKALIIPTLMHGAYDFGLSYTDLTAVLALLLSLCIDIAAIIYVKRELKNDLRIELPVASPVPPQAQPAPATYAAPAAPATPAASQPVEAAQPQGAQPQYANFCPACGAPAQGGKFCRECGQPLLR